ncbi:MAG: SMC-Scp complex subunit ScpB [Promethearchaeota archaeon]|nr:MAG: SMC-Scp complex subunit ScpB [Candidatus Lokiarchaeota archaeon]
MVNLNEETKENSEQEDNEDIHHKDENTKELIVEAITDEIKDEVEVQNIGSEDNGIIRKENEIDADSGKLELRNFHKNLVEASLYVAGRPLSIEELNSKLEIPKKEIEELINELAFDYLERSTALIINQVGEDYQMALRTEYIENVSKFAKGGAIAERYLRTLTIIALKQPILKSLVVKLRGSGAYEHVKYLLDNELITAVKKGRSQELTTTDKYAEMFGLPKNKEEMKRIMITQLGLDTISSEDDQEEDLEADQDGALEEVQEESEKNQVEDQE